MNFPAEIDRVNTLKKGMKIILSVGDDDVREVMRYIHNFMKMPLNITISVDADQQKELLDQITDDQRRKVYALIKDIALWSGNTSENMKEEMKLLFASTTEIEPFSLSNCKKETASAFIEWMINFAFEQGISLTDQPRDMVDNLETYLRLCLKNRVCVICGKVADLHHVNAIGMGRDRTKVDDSDSLKVALCRIHHGEAHNKGWRTFAELHHIEGIKV